jgi:hypothetical protein
MVGPRATSGEPMGDAPTVSDAIAGRTAALAEVLQARADVVEPLARLAGFLNP